MTPTQLQQFLAIIENGSLGRAARQLNISQPALSKRLKDLESAFGVPLMERGPRGMTPTPFGTCVAHHARIVRGEFGRMLDNLSVLKNGGAGHIAIGSSPSFSESLVADAVTALRQKQPSIRVTTCEGLLNDLMPLLVRGEIDMAVVTLDHSVLEEDVAQTRLGSDPTYLLARPTHPLARRKKVQLNELLDYPWLLARSSDRLRACLEQRMSEFGLTLPKPAIEFGSVALAKRMLAEHDLLTFMPSTVMRDDLAAGRFITINVPELKWERSIGIVHRKAPLSPLSTAMIRELELVSRKRNFA